MQEKARLHSVTCDQKRCLKSCTYWPRNAPAGDAAHGLHLNAFALLCLMECPDVVVGRGEGVHSLLVQLRLWKALHMNQGKLRK